MSMKSSNESPITERRQYTDPEGKMNSNMIKVKKTMKFADQNVATADMKNDKEIEEWDYHPFSIIFRRGRMHFFPTLRIRDYNLACYW